MQTLLRDDWIGVVAFDSAPAWVAPLKPNRNPQATQGAIRSIGPAGGTSIQPALTAAYQALSALTPAQVAVKHVLLLTDGRGEGGGYTDLVKQMKQAGITLSTVAVGDDADQALLARLAHEGRGRFYSISDPHMLPRVFIKEALTLRATLIREKTFTPRLADAASPMVSGISSFAPLRGMVRTWPKAKGVVRIPLVSDQGDVVLAHWHAGLGQAAVFTSDNGSRWATAWAGSMMFDKFWNQLVRTVARPSNSAGVEARIVKTDANHARMIVEATGPEGEFKDFLSAGATILGPDPRQAAAPVRLIQVGPGAYQGDFEIARPGTYLAMVGLTGINGETGWTPVAYVADASRELRDLTSNEAAIQRVAARTGGRVLRPFSHHDPLFDRLGLDPRFVSLPLRDWLIEAAAVVLLLDVAARRLAWDRQSLGAARAAVAGFIRSRTQVRPTDARGSLGALKQARQSVAERLHTQTPGEAAHAFHPVAMPRKVTPGDASAPISPVSSPAPPDAPSSDHTSGTLDRLAQAKRRARRGP